jgi:ABC-type multidrug transport system fused ATPase/permease subunit
MTRFLPLRPLHQNLGRLWRHIGSLRRGQLGLLLVLMILAAFAEVLSIGAVLPFLGVLTAPERIFKYPILQPFIQAWNITSPDQLMLPLTIVFGLAAIIAGMMRLVLLLASTRLTFATGADLSIDIYRRTLYQPYSVHIARNSSEVINGISVKATSIIYGIVVPLLTLASSSIMLIVIMSALLSVDLVIGLLAFGGFGMIYLLIMRQMRKRLTVGSQHIAYESTQVIKAMQEGLGGIRDILIDGTQSVYCNIYRRADLGMRQAQSSRQFISDSPRYATEAFGMLLIATLAYVLTQQTGGAIKAIPVLGAFAFGAQRLLPFLQQAYVAWSGIQGSHASLQDALDLLDQPLPDHAEQYPVKPLIFQHQISLRQVSFRYGLHTPLVLKNVSLDIAKGSRVGFIGTTGSGKSTLLDIVMGLLIPSEGVLVIDNVTVEAANFRAWQAHIAHVPQSIFLSDSTITENIAFGVPPEKIDHERVRIAAQKAQIASTIESWDKQYQTLVGERGIRLSGGQRQRIGIARALYKQADVIVFDEATSALDNETERAVMEAIEELGEELTIFIVAHRLTTLKNCTQVVELSDGIIKRVGTYAEIV